MYNEEIKQRFIEDYSENDTTKVNTRRILNTLSGMEEKHGKDIYFLEFKVVAKEIFQHTKVLSYMTYYQYLMTIKMYKQWCMMNGIFDDTHYFPIKMISEVDIKKYYSEFMEANIFRSFVELHKYIDEIFELDLTSDNIKKQELLKLFILLLYHGIHEKDIFKLNIDNIIVKNNGVFIEYKNKLVQIQDNETAKILIKRKKCSTYEIDRGRWTEYIDLHNIMVNFGSIDIEYNNKQTKGEISRYIKAYNKKRDEIKKIQPFNIYVSGLIRQIKEEENLNGEFLKINALYQRFLDNGYPEDIDNRSKKKIIKETYKVW